jgi:hypothetical protein
MWQFGGDGDMTVRRTWWGGEALAVAVKTLDGRGDELLSGYVAVRRGKPPDGGNRYQCWNRQRIDGSGMCLTSC